MRTAPVSRSVPESLAVVAEKGSSAAVSLMVIAAGVANSGVSLAAVILTVKVAVP